MPSLDLAFDEFVGTLIRNVFEAVVATELDQENQLAALRQEASVPAAELASGLDDAALDTFLSELFPDADQVSGHAIAPGVLYVPADPGPEDPAIEATLGLTLVAGVDLDRAAGGLALTVAGVENVRERARLVLATRQQATLRRSLEQGIPRVLVDAGRVSARLELSLVAETPTPVAHPIPIFARRPVEPRPVPARRAVVAPRLRVRPANPRAPETYRLTADVFGEVEIRFKTVSR